MALRTWTLGIFATVASVYWCSYEPHGFYHHMDCKVSCFTPALQQLFPARSFSGHCCRCRPIRAGLVRGFFGRSLFDIGAAVQSFDGHPPAVGSRDSERFGTSLDLGGPLWFYSDGAFLPRRSMNFYFSDLFSQCKKHFPQRPRTGELRLIAKGGQSMKAP